MPLAHRALPGCISEQMYVLKSSKKEKEVYKFDLQPDSLTDQVAGEH